ncbi:MAG: hypothetical protein NVV63_14090 [Opitutus sp.]|nr:hypothetical protein [Opitutus sp.]
MLLHERAVGIRPLDHDNFAFQPGELVRFAVQIGETEIGCRLTDFDGGMSRRNSGHQSRREDNEHFL